MTAITLLILSLFLSNLKAPDTKAVYLIEPERVNPYEAIWNAVITIESNSNPLAYHMEKNGCASIGIAQIQQSRLDDFRSRTGIAYSLADMYSPDKAKSVFMHYASEIQPHNIERISREWNGGAKGMSKKSTIKYYLKVKAKL